MIVLHVEYCTAGNFQYIIAFLSPVLVRNFYSVDFMSHVDDIHTAYSDLYHMGEN